MNAPPLWREFITYLSSILSDFLLVSSFLWLWISERIQFTEEAVSTGKVLGVFFPCKIISQTNLNTYQLHTDICMPFSEKVCHF